VENRSASKYESKNKGCRQKQTNDDLINHRVYCVNREQLDHVEQSTKIDTGNRASCALNKSPSRLRCWLLLIIIHYNNNNNIQSYQNAPRVGTQKKLYNMTCVYRLGMA